MESSLERIEKYLQSSGKNQPTGSMLLRDVAYERLKEAIRSVDVVAGDPLSESRLSILLGISRTPVREALQQLVADGLLQAIPGRAVVIASHSIQQVSDALRVRELLEPEVVRLAAGALSEAEGDILKRCTSEMEAAAKEGNRSEWARVDGYWHEMLCNLCSNQLLGQMVLQARNHMHNQGASSQVTDQFLIDGTAEHRHVVQCVLSNDGEGAAQAMLDHLYHVRANIFR